MRCHSHVISCRVGPEKLKLNGALNLVTTQVSSANLHRIPNHLVLASRPLCFRLVHGNKFACLQLAINNEKIKSTRLLQLGRRRKDHYLAIVVLSDLFGSNGDACLNFALRVGEAFSHYLVAACNNFVKLKLYASALLLCFQIVQCLFIVYVVYFNFKFFVLLEVVLNSYLGHPFGVQIVMNHLGLP